MIGQRAWRAAGLFALLCASNPADRAAAATISGAVVDSTIGAPVEGVLIRAIPSAGGPAAGSSTDARGRFTFRDLPAESYILFVSGIGVERRRVGPFTVAAGESLEIAISTAPSAIRLDPVVVTASRHPEKLLDAPASISLVGARAIAERPAITPIAHVRSLAGLDVAAKGINQTSAVARGFSSAQSTALLAITDYRITSIPSLRYNLFHLLPTPNEDMARIEVVRGPAAALYGPNSDRGVLHILTRSPIDEPGSAMSVTTGDRGVVEVSMRHASHLTPDWGYKISGQYFRGDDWEYVDPVEVARRNEALARGADPETLRIGRRDLENERAGGEAQVEWRPRPGATLICAAGLHRAIHDIEQTAIGAVQVRDWGSSYLQLRGSKGRLFAQVFVNRSDAGETYFLRSGAPVVDRSRLWAAQVQHGLDAGPRTRVTVGFDALRTDPRTGGTIMGRNEADDTVRETGAYAHSVTRIGPTLEAVAALRVDDHSRFRNPVLSPRGALVFTPREGQSLRMTYNRAFGTPATDDLFADLVYDSLRPLPFAVRVEGVPRNGYSFLRDADGPLMRSPFTPSEAGGPASYLPADATLLWQTVVAIAQSQGADISSIPPPTSSEVASRLRTLEPDGTFAPVSGVADLPPLEPTITNAFEWGYRGLVAGRVRVGIDAYHTRIEHFIGHLRVITPNVFLEPTTLEAYLSNYMSSSAADSLAQALAQVPLGTITPREARDPYDLILAVRNFGSVSYWGSDLSVLVGLTDRISLGGTFSWVGRNLFHGVGGLEDLSLNAPAWKGSIEVSYHDPAAGWSADARVRSVASFPILSGVYAGDVRSYTLVDLRFGAPIATAPKTALTVSAENALDDRHQEFVGAPAVGRLLLARLGVEF